MDSFDNLLDATLENSPIDDLQKAAALALCWVDEDGELVCVVTATDAERRDFMFRIAKVLTEEAMTVPYWANPELRN